MKFYAGILLFFLLLLTEEARTQTDIRFRSLTTKDGLSGDVVYCLLEDHNGFLWIGTHRGLNRYDGYQFKQFMNDPDDSTTISSDHIHDITEDNQGNLWLCTLNGINRLDPRSGSIRRYLNREKGSLNEFRYMQIVSDSSALVISTSGCYWFGLNSGEFRLLNELSTQFISPFFSNPDGALFVQTQVNIVWRWDPSTRSLVVTDQSKMGLTKSLPSIGPSVYDESGRLSTISKSGYERTWQCGNSGKAFTSSYQLTNQIGVYGLKNFHDGGLWCYYGDGIVRYDFSQKQYFTWLHEPGNESSLNNNSVTDMLRDRNGNYWVATFGSGISHFQFGNTGFHQVSLPRQAKGASEMVRGLVATRTGRILGSNQGEMFVIEPGLKARMMDARDATLASLVRESTGLRLEQYSKKERAFVQLSSSLITENFGSTLLADQKNRLWIIGDKIRNSDTQITHNLHREGNILIDSANNFLIPSREGIFYFNTANFQLAAVKVDRNSPFKVEGKHCKWIQTGKNGIFWIATASEGLVKWDTRSNRMVRYTTRDGLPDNHLYVLLADQHKRVWISTDRGLSCFDPEANRFVNFSAADGLSNTEYNSASGCMDREGRMYFGGMNGLDCFFPDSIPLKKTPPEILFSGCRLFEKDLPLNKKNYLAPDENTFTISYTTNELVASRNIIFRYRLSSVDPDWVIRQGENNATYNKLPPGDYAFEVCASFDRQHWGPANKLQFSIAAPFYRQTWFTLLITLIAAAAVFGLYRYRLRQQLKLFAVRQRIHRDLHDDIGATLSSVKAYSEILKDNPGNLVIADLIRENSSEMIDNLDVIAWATDPQHDHLKSLTGKMQKFAAPLLHARGISWEFRMERITEELIIPGNVRQHLFLVFKEAVNNIIKYAEAGECLVSFSQVSGRFILQIRDDGKGFDGHIRGEGNGWKNMQKRIEEIRGRLDIQSLPGKGTLIIVSLPFPFSSG